MYKKKKELLVNWIFNFFIMSLGVFVFSSCDKSSPEVENGGQVKPNPDAVLISLSIKTAPTRVAYFINDSFSDAGLIVEGKYDDGTSVPIASEKLVFSGFNSDKPDPQQIVKITYGGLSVDLSIEIYPFKVKDGTELTEYVEDAASVVIPAGVVSIAPDVFLGKSMISVTFPETLVSIGEYAFFSCRSLEKVVLPSSLQKIGEGIFDACTSLSFADLSKTALTEIGGYMFSRCSNLSDVKFPENILSIESLAFSGTTSLKNVVIPINTRFIGLDAFRESGLERISLPNNIKVIRQRAFLGCASLTEVTTYGVLTPSDDEYFPLLESSSFQNVPALIKLEIPLGISIFGQTILSGCPLLEEITIPVTVAQIGFRAFANSSLKRIIMASATPPTAVPATGTTAWDAIPSTCSITVPASAIDAYKQAFGWNQYTNMIKGY